MGCAILYVGFSIGRKLALRSAAGRGKDAPVDATEGNTEAMESNTVNSSFALNCDCLAREIQKSRFLGFKNTISFPRGVHR